MYCRKCLKKNRKSINMNVDTENSRYICPKCNKVVNWIKEDMDLEKF